MNDAAVTLEGKHIKIANDIDFTGVVFKAMANNGVIYFQGTMDGAGMTIKGITYAAPASYKGAIGVIGEFGKVANLIIEGKVTSEFTYTGGFVGDLFGELENCISQVEITSTKGYVAGMAGRINGTAKLTDCLNKGAVTGSAGNIAGITGSSLEGAQYIRVGNEGTITHTGTSAYVGGLIATCLPATFEDCYNIGTIIIEKETSVTSVAGLIAYANGTANSGVYIMNRCYNTADITAKALIAGLVANANTSGYNTMLITDCYNTGDVTAAATSSTASSPTAGISSFYTGNSVFTNCWNSGNITSSKNQSTAGIAGYFKGSTVNRPIVFSKCYNTGDITALTNQGGGILAYVQNNCTLDSCYNTGNIEGG